MEKYLHLDQISEPEYIDTTNEDKWKRKELWGAIADFQKYNAWL
ncbi:MAG: hypothetical protein Ct9H90mP20_2970 [Candidatus Neomarinimicrobiota bacterium]|nr:MAG: hypothetical protein Ct9H90mP20_2970 [Candidatus Neomarinimicrobiota bacterium]